jgi:hypothetical protein
MQKIFIITLSFLVLIGTWIGVYILLLDKNPIIDISTTVTPDTPKTEDVVTVPLTPYQEMQAKIKEENSKNIASYNNAVSTKNPELCNTITEENKKIECHDTIVASEAKKTWLIETCNTITATGTLILCRDNIRNDRAIASRNKVLCERISSPERKIFCQESVDELILKWYIESKTVTKENCDGLSSKYQAICMTEIRETDESTIYADAIAKNDIVLCEKITNTELRSTCLDTINLKTAISTQNSVLCDSLENTEKKRYCINQVSQINDIAIYKLATSSNSMESCATIINVNLRNKCNDTVIMSIVKASNDTNLCDTLTNTAMTRACRQLWQ